MSVETLIQAVSELEEEQVQAEVKEMLERGIAPLDLIKALQEGMVEVGNRFEQGNYFLSELVLAGEILKETMNLLRPHVADEKRQYRGTIVIGTVQGDIHDLGKNIIAMLFEGSGYNVIDLGVDVPKEKFVEAVKETGAQLVGMSVLLTACQEALKDTIVALREAGLTPKTVIGGNYVDERVKAYTGADYYAFSAAEGLKVAKEVFG